MEHPKNKSNNRQGFNDQKSKKILELEKEVELGLWIQVIGQFVEIKGLTGLLHIEEDTNVTGEKQILTGAWIRTIGQILEAISVSSQIWGNRFTKTSTRTNNSLLQEICLCQLVQLMK